MGKDGYWTWWQSKSFLNLGFHWSQMYGHYNTQFPQHLTVSIPRVGAALQQPTQPEVEKLLCCILFLLAHPCTCASCRAFITTMISHWFKCFSHPYLAPILHWDQIWPSSALSLQDFAHTGSRAEWMTAWMSTLGDFPRLKSSEA
jgi:hypothetical protein